MLVLQARMDQWIEFDGPCTVHLAGKEHATSVVLESDGAGYRVLADEPLQFSEPGRFRVALVNNFRFAFVAIDAPRSTKVKRTPTEGTCAKDLAATPW